MRSLGQRHCVRNALADRVVQKGTSSAGWAVLHPKKKYAAVLVTLRMGKKSEY